MYRNVIQLIGENLLLDQMNDILLCYPGLLEQTLRSNYTTCINSKSVYHGLCVHLERQEMMDILKNIMGWTL